MVVEVHVAFVLHGDKVYMGVGYLETKHGHADFAAGAYLLDGARDAVGEIEQFVVERVVEVEDVVYFLLGDAEHMAADNGVDVEECETVFGFGYFVAGDFASYDFGKDRGHGD